MPDTLHNLLRRLITSFDPDAVEPFFKDAAVGLMVPPPDFEAWTLRLHGDQIALLPGLDQAEIVIQAPLDVLRAGLVPGGEWDIQRGAHLVGIATPGDGALIQRVLRPFHITTRLPRLDLRRAPVSAQFGLPLRHPAGENTFALRREDPAPLPVYDAARLPALIADEHPGWTALYDYAWQTAFGNLRRPAPESGFVASYIDPAFNDAIFLWDSCFMTMFGRYADHVFPFIRTLDNFYAKQHPDGFICREITMADGIDRFTPHDPRSTGPNILAWTEWIHYQFSGDEVRLAAIFPVLVAYHDWLRDWRTWPDGSYWTTGLASGMDNQTRVPDAQWHHRHYRWLDSTLQQALDCLTLREIAAVIGRPEFNARLQAEHDRLAEIVNTRLWDEASGFYYDSAPDGSLSPVKSIGAYWGLLAAVVPPGRAARLIAHLDHPASFNRPHRIPAQAADSPGYDGRGAYWRGGVWPPANYMVLQGLERAEQHDLAYAIARNHLDAVTRVFEQTGTLWEDYAPDQLAPGYPAAPKFVGWTGLSAINIPIEYVIGLRRVGSGRLMWDIRLTERHGVERYPLGKGRFADLICAARARADEPPSLTVRLDRALTLETRWAGHIHTWTLGPGAHSLTLAAK